MSRHPEANFSESVLEREGERERERESVTNRDASNVKSFVLVAFSLEIHSIIYRCCNPLVFGCLKIQ